MPTIPDGAVCVFDNLLFKKWNYYTSDGKAACLIQWKRLSADTKKALDLRIYELHRKHDANLMGTLKEFLDTYESVYNAERRPGLREAMDTVINGLSVTKPPPGERIYYQDILGPRYPYGRACYKAFSSEKKLSPKPPIVV